MSVPDETTGLMALLDRATRAVPRVRFAWGVVGVGAAAAILQILLGANRLAVIAVFAVIVAMILLFVFSRIEKSTEPIVRACGQALLIAVTFTFVALLATSLSAAIGCAPRTLVALYGLREVCEASPQPAIDVEAANEDEATTLAQEAVHKIVRGVPTNKCRTDPKPGTVQLFERGWLIYRNSPGKIPSLIMVVRDGTTEKVTWESFPDGSTDRTSQGFPCPNIPGEKDLEWGFRWLYCLKSAVKEQLGKPITKAYSVYIQYQDWSNGLLLASLPWQARSFDPARNSNNEFDRLGYYEMDAVFLENGTSTSSGSGAMHAFMYNSFRRNAWCTALWQPYELSLHKGRFKALLSSCADVVMPTHYAIPRAECSYDGH